MKENPLKDDVLEQLKREFLMDEAAPRKMAAVARARINAAVEKGMAPKDAVAHACHAVLLGLLLIDKPIPKGAVSALHGVNAAAQDRQWDSMEALSWALEGLARAKTAAPEAAMRETLLAIDSAFMGAGEAFGALIR